MLRIPRLALLLLCLGTMLVVMIPPSEATAISPQLPSLTYPVRHENLTIYVGLIGLSNMSVHEASLERDLTTSFDPVLQSSGLSYGTSFKVQYLISFSSQSTNQSLRDFVQSSLVIEKPPAYLQQSLGVHDDSTYAVINAGAVQNWVSEMHQQLGIIDTRYSIIVANLTGISTYDHYYEVLDSERDQGFSSARYASTGYSSLYYPVVSWLFSWGGTSRSYFIDLSAGSQDPAHDYTFRAPPHVPIQYLATKHLTPTDQDTTQYVADYLNEVVRNVVFQNYFVFPPLSSQYNIEIYLIDDTGRVLESNYAQFLNESLVHDALQSLIPYANFTVDLHYVQLSSELDLSRQVHKSLLAETPKIGFGDTAVTIGYYDAQQLRSYLRTQLTSYVNESKGEVVPIFCFALRSGSRLVDVHEGNIVRDGIPDPDGSPRGAAILTYPELSLVSLSERQLFDWGSGFTHAAIQAAGHMLGMQTLTIGEFSMADAESSAMSQQAYEYQFSQFDKDAIQRAHADYLISLDKEQLDALSTLSVQGLGQNFQARALLDNVTAQVKFAQQSYDSLNFGRAVQESLSAYGLIDQLFEAQAQWLKKTLDSLPAGSNVLVASSLRSARGELMQAITARTRNDIVNSFQLLTQSTIDAAIGKNAETAYGTSRLSHILLGLLLGVPVGIALSLFATLTWKRQQARAPHRLESS